MRQGRSTPYIGDKLIPPLIGNPYNGYINPQPSWEPATFIFRDYNPYIGGLKPFIFHGFGGPKVVGGLPHPILGCVRKLGSMASKWVISPTYKRGITGL